MNDFGEAIPGKGPGVVNPFHKNEKVMTGELFWLVLDPKEVATVSHHWEYESSFVPTREITNNKWLTGYAEEYGVTYKQLMDACDSVVNNKGGLPYPGTKTAEELETLDYDLRYEIWSEWSSEVDYEFSNYGSECCPEYSYPEDPLFVVEEK